MDNDNLNIYKLGARQGLWAGAYFSVIFLCQTAGAGSLFTALLGNLLVIAVPFILFVLLRNHYRRRLCLASFSEVWMHGIMIFLCGSAILALVTVIYLKYIDPGFIYRETAQLISAYRSLGSDWASQMADLLQVAASNHALPSPIQCAISFLWLGGFSGSVLSLIETPFVKLFTHR